MSARTLRWPAPLSPLSAQAEKGKGEVTTRPVTAAEHEGTHARAGGAARSKGRK
jgi:hypothetical protein